MNAGRNDFWFQWKWWLCWRRQQADNCMRPPQPCKVNAVSTISNLWDRDAYGAISYDLFSCKIFYIASSEQDVILEYSLIQVPLVYVMNLHIAGNIMSTGLWMPFVLIHWILWILMPDIHREEVKCECPLS